MRLDQMSPSKLVVERWAKLWVQAEVTIQVGVGLQEGVGMQTKVQLDPNVLMGGEKGLIRLEEEDHVGLSDGGNTSRGGNAGIGGVRIFKWFY
ncbi:hypothetical protein O6P43_032374 [Quillaja saponaria]|uniref:Uncharacterized protein n=1 Tax=Quillaja saponaria TaxID=32244 RepID=A0AAD7KMW4_QUISA|nr:hypothetical protein O6P43_032374 [Quillaja saponaria]